MTLNANASFKQPHILAEIICIFLIFTMLWASGPEAVVKDPETETEEPEQVFD